MFLSEINDVSQQDLLAVYSLTTRNHGKIEERISRERELNYSLCVDLLKVSLERYIVYISLFNGY